MGRRVQVSHFCYLELEPLHAHGHHLNLIESILRDVGDTGRFEGASFIGNADAGAEARDRLTRLGFERVLADVPRVHLPNEPNNILAVADALRRAVERIPADDVVLFSSMPSPYVLLAIALALRPIPLTRRLQVIVRLAMTDEEWAWFECRLSAIINFVSLTPTLRDRFVFTVESARLRDYYAERTGYRFPIQFGPISRTLVRSTRDKWAEYDAERGPFNLAFIGEAREEKGFQHLPDFVERFAAVMPTARFHIQCNASPVNDTPTVVSARNRLLALRDGPLNGRLVLYLSPLPYTLYQAVLSKAHALLLPYLAERYACRGSGIAFEGLQADALILVTGDTDLEVTFDMCPGTIPFDFTTPDPETVLPALAALLRERAAARRELSHDDLDHCGDLLFSRTFFERSTLGEMSRDLRPASASPAAIARLDRELETLRVCTRETLEDHLFDRVFAATRARHDVVA